MSGRMQAAQALAQRRLWRDTRLFVPIRMWVALIVAAVTATSKPGIGLDGEHLAVLICLIVFVVEMLGWPLTRATRPTTRALELAVFGACAVALAGLQPDGLGTLPGSAVVFTAGFALAPVLAASIGGAVSVGLAVVLSRAHAPGGGAGISAAVLLCAVLGVTGALLRRYRLNQERTERLLAELEDARDDQARAAAAEERASIARELHDVLAHSLSGLSIRLEVARKLAATTDAAPDLRDAISAAATLAKQGVAGARDAVAALRRDDQLGIDELPDLVDQFRRDLGVDVTYHLNGTPRPVSADLALALYRATGEALTNVARHAAGAVTRVDLTFTPGNLRLAVTNEAGQRSALANQGSGWGLAGIRERIKRLGGDLAAGPYGTGWTVVITAPTGTGVISDPTYATSKR